MQMPNASQTIAIVAITAALLGGAFALGRSSQHSAPEAPAAETMPPARLAAADTAAQTEQPARPLTPAPKAVVAPKPQPQTAEPAAKAQPLCGDCSRVVSVRSEEREGEGSGLGAIGGAVIGGILGNQVGGGSGKKIATVGGAVAGGYAGNEIEKRQKSKRVWIVRLEHKDGSSRTLERASDPGLKAGDIVELRDGELRRH